VVNVFVIMSPAAAEIDGTGVVIDGGRALGRG
jgi:hypothetical protein